MKNIFLVLFLSFTSHQLSAQNISLEWAKSAGGNDTDHALSIDIDSSGCVYTTGYFYSTVDFDPGPGTYNMTSSGYNDIYVQKLDSNGDFLWAISAGDQYADYGSSITIDNSGNIYVTGFFRGTVDFDPGPGTYNLSSINTSTVDSYILKLDGNGNLLWAKPINGTGQANGYSIVTDNANNIYVGGAFNGTYDFDPGASAFNMTGTHDGFILKLDDQGNFNWAKAISGDDNQHIKSIAIDPNQNLLISGSYRDTCDFDPSAGVLELVPIGGSDNFIGKYDPSGNLMWAKSFGGTLDEDCRSITTDAAGNVFTTGFFRDTVDFDPNAGVVNIISNGSYDLFVQKLDSNGDLVWANSIGGSSVEYGYSITTDKNDNLIITGAFVGTVDFDPGPGINELTGLSSNEIFLQKLDNNGNLIWAESFPGNGNDFGNAVTTDNDNNIYLCGSFSNTVDFNPGTGSLVLASNGGYFDFFVQKLSPCPDSIIDNQTSCTSFQWIDGVTYFTSNNTALQTFTNVDGCDSVVTLNLTINYPSSGTDQQSACDSYLWIDGITYSSNNNTATHTLTNSVGCDSIVTLDLTINYSSFGTDIITACNSYTWIDGNTYNSSNNTATDTLVNAIGCDSIVTLDLTIIINSTATDVQASCNAFNWIDGTIYTSNNTTATYNITNGAVNGCDSIVTLDFTFTGVTSTDSRTECSPFVWIDGNTYTSNNSTATFNIVGGAAGCDSIIALNLTILNPSSAIDLVTACDSYTWMDGITYTSNNSTATYTLLNAAGCDSVITLDLTITNSSTSIDLVSSCYAYTWIDGTTYTTSNNSATWVLTNITGCDSIVTLDLTINYSNSGTAAITECDSFNWIDGNTYTASNNTATHILTNTAGCDSVVTLDLTINYSTTHSIIETGIDIVTINGQDYTSSGVYTQQLTNAVGCDSTLTIDVQLDFTGVEEHVNEIILLTPNPATNTITIQGINFDLVESISIMDATGRVCNQFKYTGNAIDISDLVSGYYFVQINTNIEIHRLRFTKQ